MRTNTWLLTFVGLALSPLTAAAQPGMTPYYAQPPAPLPAAAEPRTHLELGLVAASPKGDWADVPVTTSPGFHLSLSLGVAPSVSVFAGLRYIKVKTDDSDGSFDNIDLSHREMQIGLRFTSPLSPSAKFFLEGNVHAATVSVSTDGQSQTESGMGLGIRGGVLVMVDARIGIGGAVSYAAASISPEDTEFEDAWLAGDAFLSFGF